MSKSTISTFELFQMFPDAESARVYMEGKRWPDGAVCPACDEAKRITTRKGGFYYLESENRFSFRGIDLSDVTIEEATAALTMLAVGRAAPLPDYGA
jgi:hypothetical protein